MQIYRETREIYLQWHLGVATVFGVRLTTADNRENAIFSRLQTALLFEKKTAEKPQKQDGEATCSLKEGVYFEVFRSGEKTTGFHVK